MPSKQNPQPKKTNNKVETKQKTEVKQPSGGKTTVQTKSEKTVKPVSKQPITKTVVTKQTQTKPVAKPQVKPTVAKAEVKSTVAKTEVKPTVAKAEVKSTVAKPTIKQPIQPKAVAKPEIKKPVSQPIINQPKVVTEAKIIKPGVKVEKSMSKTPIKVADNKTKVTNNVKSKSVSGKKDKLVLKQATHNQILKVERYVLNKTKRIHTLIINFTWLILLVAAIVGFVFYYTFELNVFVTDLSIYLDATVKSVLTIIIALGVQRVLNLALNVIKLRNQRMRTISVLGHSLIKYVIGIFTLVMLLIYFLGEQYITELFAGLGVVALVIGLGCQSLISDIVAGIFMVFEGNFEVGDVVVINNWRGTVVGIGLRTSVIEDIGGNKMIINNTNITELINNSQSLSTAVCKVGIEYDEPLERVEAIIAKNLEHMKQQIPLIRKGPFYKGVQELGSSSVNLLFIANCKEDDIFQVQRDLNRQIKLLFDANDINIPFNQVTVSERVKSKNKATAADKRIANELSHMKNIQHIDAQDK